MRVPRKTTTMAIISLAALGCSEFPTQPRIDPPANGLRTESVLPSSLADAALTSNAFSGERNAVEGAFTSPLAELPGGALVGQVVHVGRGCPAGLDLSVEDPYLADPDGKIALIARGTCPFVDKILRAQVAGAIGVIVYNTDGPTGEELVRMGTTDDVDVTIPGVFVQHSTGALLRDGTAPVMATIRALTPAESLEDAIATIGDAGLLSEGQINALLQKLAHAQAKIAAGQYQSAIGILNAFINQVSDLVATGQISSSDGEVLISLAQELIDSISS